VGLAEHAPEVLQTMRAYLLEVHGRVEKRGGTKKEKETVTEALRILTEIPNIRRG
jgi:hypothetical protein